MQCHANLLCPHQQVRFSANINSTAPSCLHSTRSIAQRSHQPPPYQHLSCQHHLLLSHSRRCHLDPQSKLASTATACLSIPEKPILRAQIASVWDPASPAAQARGMRAPPRHSERRYSNSREPRQARMEGSGGNSSSWEERPVQLALWMVASMP